MIPEHFRLSAPALSLPPTQESWLVWGGLCAGLAVWIAVLVLMALFLSSLLGWAYFAKRYRCDRQPENGRKFSYCSAAFGWFAWYNNCLDAVVTQEAIYLRPIFPFRFCHPGIQLPWRLVRSAKRRRLLFFEMTQLDIEDVAGRLKVFLPARATASLPRDLASTN